MATAVKQSVKSLRSQKKERVESVGRRQRPRHVMAIAFLALGLVGVALLHVWLRLQVVHMGYVLSTTSKLQVGSAYEVEDLATWLGLRPTWP